LADHHPFSYYWFAFISIILVRYFSIAGGTHFLVHSLFKELLVKQGISIADPVWSAIYQDIKLSVSSTAIFASGAAFVMFVFDRGGTSLYVDLDRYGFWYLGFSFGLVLFIQDTYFYFLHRLFHHPLLFPWLHHGHHRSRQTTVWTSFAFDPAEAISQTLLLMTIVWIIPLHFITIIAIIMTMTVWSVLNHIGFSLFPTTGYFSWCRQWAIGPLHHSVHHRKYTKHYGLYFTFWDKMLGTNDPNYAAVKPTVHERSLTLNPSQIDTPDNLNHLTINQNL
jgi:sterol desaturase/sphingolipid hydroxylase (fatty acid hydroxylase superfamily)